MNEQNEELFTKAADFIERCYGELGLSADQQQQRLQDIKNEIEVSGTYTHTPTELTHGAKWPGATATVASVVCFGKHLKCSIDET